MIHALLGPVEPIPSAASHLACQYVLVFLALWAIPTLGVAQNASGIWTVHWINLVRASGVWIHALEPVAVVPPAWSSTTAQFALARLATQAIPMLPVPFMHV